jgi:hypothetical protein
VAAIYVEPTGQTGSQFDFLKGGAGPVLVWCGQNGFVFAFSPNGNPQFGRDTTSQQGLEEKIHCSVITACQLTQANVLNASTGNFPE